MSNKSLTALKRAISPAMSQSSLATFKRSDVPEYLHSSELYLSFSDETDDEISVPSYCMKKDTSITTVAGLLHLLQTMRFWILPSFPKDVVEFLVQSSLYLKSNAKVSSVLEEFDHVFPGVFPLVCELKTCRYEQSSNRVCNISAKHGRVDFLDYFLTQKKPINSRTLQIAASNGHLVCVEYIYNHFLAQNGTSKFLAGMDCCELIQRGHLHVLKFLVQHEVHSQQRISCGDHWCVEAIMYGQFACLKYLLALFHNTDEWVTTTAVENGDVSILQCVVEHGCKVGTATWKAALRATSSACLQYLLDTYPDAIGHTDLLEVVACAQEPALHLLLARGYPFTPALVSQAATAGNMQCLLFLHEQLHYDCFVPATMAAAAAAGQLHLVKLLHKHECKWDETAPTAAMRADEAPCLMFLLQLRGVPKTADYLSVDVGERCMRALQKNKMTVVGARMRQIQESGAAPNMRNLSAIR